MLRLMTLPLMLAACGSGGSNAPTPPNPGLNEEFTLSPGQTVAVTGANLSLTFEKVSEDSRCPEDVTCIWEGDAIVVLRVKVEAEEVTREVHTQGGDTRLRKAPVGDYVVTLVRLDPVPRSTSPIEPSAYRVTLTVSRE